VLFTVIVSLVAGLLTVLAPCVLPLLPVILGGSVVRDGHDRWRPYIITGGVQQQESEDLRLRLAPEDREQCRSLTSHTWDIPPV
jgi:hypothetical protein